MIQSKQQEKMQVQKINRELLEKIRLAENENMEEKKKRIIEIKEHEKIIPFKVRYLQMKKKEKVKELLFKKAEEEESVMNEKQQELSNLERMELDLQQQIEDLSRSKLEVLELSSNKSVIIPNKNFDPNGRNFQQKAKTIVKPCDSYM